MTKPQVNNCCFCIPLKSGVIIITLLWLISGIYMIITNSLSIASPDENGFIFDKVRSIASIVYNALLTFGSAFGLYVLTYANIPRMLSIYSKIAYSVVGINIIRHLLTAIVFIVFKADILKLCAELLANIFPDNEISKACNDGYGDVLKSIIMTAVVSTLVSAYFAIVIASYAQKRNEEEKETTAADAETHLYEKTSRL